MFSRLEFAQKTASIKCVQIKIDFYYSRHRDATNRNIIVHKMSFYSAVSTDKKVRFLAYIYTPPLSLSLLFHKRDIYKQILGHVYCDVHAHLTVEKISSRKSSEAVN